MKPSEVLRAARELISVPERWTQRAYARTVQGREIGPNEENAACFCSAGALQRAEGVFPRWYETKAYKFLETATRVYSVTYFNDHHTHADVLAAFDRAVALAKQSEAVSA